MRLRDTKRALEDAVRRQAPKAVWGRLERITKLQRAINAAFAPLFKFFKEIGGS